MVIYIEGNDSFLARHAINQIKKKYLEKNPDGVELLDIDATEGVLNWADLQAVPLFAQTRLIIIRRAGQLAVGPQESLATYLKNLPTSSIVVVWHETPGDAKSPLAAALVGADKKISVQTPTGAELAKHLRGRLEAHGLTLAKEEQARLLSDYSQDLWGLETELSVLALGGQGAKAKTTTAEPFALYRAVQRGSWEQAKSLLRQEFQAGTPVELLIGSIASALRKASDSPAKPTATEMLSDIDLGLKTGLLDQGAAVALLCAGLPQGRRFRVEWEELWEETLGG